MNRLSIRTVLFFVIAFIYLLIGINHGIGAYDEGVGVLGASRILEGDTPYKDFWTLYAPGNFYLNALVFKILGTSIYTERILSTVFAFVMALLMYLTIKMLADKKAASITFGLCIIWAGSFQNYGTAMVPAVAAAHGCLYFVVRYFRKEKAAELFYAGLAAGLCTVFRHDSGPYVIIAALVVICWFIISRNKCSFSFGLFKKPAIFIAGIAAIALPVYGYILMAAGFSPVKECLIDGSLIVYPQHRATPYPSFLPPVAASGLLTGEVPIGKYLRWFSVRFPFYALFLIFGGAAVFAYFKRRKTGVDPEVIAGFVLLILYGLICANYVRIRSDPVHLYPIMMPAFALMAWVATSAPAKKTYRIPVITLICVIAVFTVYDPVVRKLEMLHASVLKSPEYVFDSGPAKGISWERHARLFDQSIKYIQKNTAPDERIFVGNSRHDVIESNNVMFYYLAQRPSATRYHELHAGVATEAEMQKLIIEELERSATRYVVLLDSGETVTKNPLDDYIQSNFEAEKRFGVHTVYKRK